VSSCRFSCGCCCWGLVRLLTSVLALQFDVFLDVGEECMRDGSPMCPEIETCVAVCRVLYTLSPADLAVAEGVSGGYADHERFFVLCFAGGQHLYPPFQGRLQSVNDELAVLDVRFTVRFLKWLCACKMLAQLDLYKYGWLLCESWSAYGCEHVMRMVSEPVMIVAPFRVDLLSVNDEFAGLTVSSKLVVMDWLVACNILSYLT
jgi:hypothetical protein